MSGRGKGKARGRGRGRGKAAVAATPPKETGNGLEKNGDVPELDDGVAPASVVAPVRTNVRLNSSSLQLNSDISDDIEEIPKEAMEVDNSIINDDDSIANIDNIADSTVSEEKDNGKNVDNNENLPATVEVEAEESSDGNTNNLASVQDKAEEADTENEKSAVEDAEMLSDDEFLAGNKEPLDTEAVSDEELQESQADTEAVSDEELQEQPANLPETEAVSDDELPEEKRKKAEVAEAEAVSEDEFPDEGKKDSTEEGGDGSGGKKRKIAEGEYDPSSPTSEASQDGTKKVAGVDSKTGGPKPVTKKVLPELEKYWKAVIDDPSDFTGWTYLLQYVDQENDVDVAREAYDAFLSHYPYCYGYWRKFADFEKRKGNVDACEAVFERGLKAIPLSVDLWLHYLNYCKTAHNDDMEFIRKQYNRALDSCGLEFRSDRLWDSYIKWEKEKKNLINITNLYDRLLAIPTQGYTTHFDNFQEHVNSNPPQTILPVDDFLEIRREVILTLKKNEKKEGPGAPGDDAPPGDDPDQEDDDFVFPSNTRMEEETTALREKILVPRKKIHKETVAAVAARWNYEEGIKRLYFHVKPLERCQLKNWKEYLDYEIEHGDENRIIVLFERCLIACALYEEFWVRFIKYLESKNCYEKMRHVYERACNIHHKKKPNLHLQWAVFEENQANYQKAADILEGLEKSVPNMLQVAYRRINLERRRGNFERAAELYEEYLSTQKNKSVITNMTVKYARFCWKMLNDIDKSIAILEKALETDKDNTRLYLQLIDMGLQKNPVDEDKIVAILDQFLEKEGDPEQKLMFAQRKIEFLEDFGSSINRIQKSHDDFNKILKQVKDRKKKADTPEPTPPPPSRKKTAEPTPPTSAPLPSIVNNSGPPNVGPPSQYPPNYYGQYPPASGGDGNNFQSGYQNYTNWNNFPQQGNYGNYGQPGWPGYGGYQPPF